MEKVITDVLETKELSDLVVEKKVSTYKAAALTEEKVNVAIGHLKNLEKLGGYSEVARLAGVTKPQAKEIHRGMRDRIAELQVAEISEEPKEEGLPNPLEGEVLR